MRRIWIKVDVKKTEDVRGTSLEKEGRDFGTFSFSLRRLLV